MLRTVSRLQGPSRPFVGEGVGWLRVLVQDAAPNLPRQPEARSMRSGIRGMSSWQRGGHLTSQGEIMDSVQQHLVSTYCEQLP